MTNAQKNVLSYLAGLLTRQLRVPRRPVSSPGFSTTKLLLIFLSVLLLCGSIVVYTMRSSLLGAGATADRSCGWRTVVAGDTLTHIARQYHTTISVLVKANAIHNANLIFVGQHLCIPHAQRFSSSGLRADGTVTWYNYAALDWSNRAQVRRLLYRVAAIHGLPAKLLLAVAWQESGWTQHVIAWDGGIGVMQLMPYTAMNINAGIGQQLDPYVLWDNLNLGAIYLKWLWHNFNGDLKKVISGYNQGGWAVVHRGIFNWPYVNNVLALMNTLD